MKDDVFYDLMYNKQGKLNHAQKMLAIMNPITNEDISELERLMKKYNFSLKSVNLNDKRCGFDLLIYGIERKVSDKMLNYIIDKAFYKNFNYLFIENDRTFKVPLFSAIQNNNFSLADHFIELGANINYIINCNVDTIPEKQSYFYPALLGNYILNNDHFKYYDEKVINEENKIMFNLIVSGNIIHYLCEEDSLNEQNLTYIINNGFNKNMIKPSLIRRLKIYKKNEYVELISRICGIQFTDEELITFDEDEIRLNIACFATNLVKLKNIEGDDNDEKDPSLPYRIKCALKYGGDSILEKNSNQSDTKSTKSEKKKSKKQKRQNKNKRKV